MKKTIAFFSLFLPLQSVYGATATFHDTEFVVYTGQATHTSSYLSQCVYVPSGQKAWGQTGSDTENYFKGFYVENGAGLDNNNANPIKLTYLGLGSQITFTTVENEKGVGHVYLHAGGKGFVLSGSGWLDIDRAYNQYINVSAMNGGTVYLNEHGMLGGTTLASSNTVEADAVLNLEDIAASSYMDKVSVGDNLWVVTRTLLTSNTDGGYANWTGTVNLDFGSGITSELLDGALTTYSASDIGKYWVIAEGDTLKVAYVMPETTTATLSLLALAGLCARRRRK